MTVTVFVIALALLVMFAGGPSEFMHILNNSMKGVVEFGAQLYHGSRG